MSHKYISTYYLEIVSLSDTIGYKSSVWKSVLIPLHHNAILISFSRNFSVSLYHRIQALKYDSIYFTIESFLMTILNTLYTWASNENSQIFRNHGEGTY